MTTLDVRAKRACDRPRCQYLDMHGKQCRKSATARVRYHGNPEHYAFVDNYASWVVVDFCPVHTEPFLGSARRL